MYFIHKNDHCTHFFTSFLHSYQVHRMFRIKAELTKAFLYTQNIMKGEKAKPFFAILDERK